MLTGDVTPVQGEFSTASCLSVSYGDSNGRETEVTVCHQRSPPVTTSPPTDRTSPDFEMIHREKD